jgi:thioredoxin-related protein
MNTAVEKKIRLVKFGSKQCAPCRELTRRRTLEKFIEKNPDIELKVWDSEKMDDPKDPANKKMDEYEVRSIPSFVWEAPDGEVVYEWEGAVTDAKLADLHEEALEGLEDYLSKPMKRPGHEDGGDEDEDAEEA